jgi:hypothetical protein
MVSKLLPLLHSLNQANNEIQHQCAEVALTGDVGPLFDDVLCMVIEDVMDFDIRSAEACTTERRHRSLREAREHHAIASHTAARTAVDHRSRRALRKTHPDARSLRRFAPRARHLRYNYFTRPPRSRHLQSECAAELLDGLSVKGGFDGTQIFIKISLDVSKGDLAGDIRDVILKPLRLLNETEFLQDLNLFANGSSVLDSVFDNIDDDISFSAGTHLEATGEKTAMIYSV